MAHQYMLKIFHGPHKNPLAPPPPSCILNGRSLIEKEIENNQKKIILIKLKKKRVLYVNLMHFIQCVPYFRLFMHALVARMRVPFSKVIKDFPILCMFLCIFGVFPSSLSFFSHILLLYEKVLVFSSYPIICTAVICTYYTLIGFV